MSKLKIRRERQPQGKVFTSEMRMYVPHPFLLTLGLHVFFFGFSHSKCVRFTKYRLHYQSKNQGLKLKKENRRSFFYLKFLKKNEQIKVSKENNINISPRDFELSYSWWMGPVKRGEKSRVEINKILKNFPFCGAPHSGIKSWASRPKPQKKYPENYEYLSVLLLIRRRIHRS